MEKEYAQALTRAAREGSDQQKLADGLIAHLKSVGRIKLLPRILRELHIAQARAKTLAPSIEVASTEGKAEAIAAARTFGIETDRVHVNHDLIRGWRARSGSVLVDRSAKDALIRIYQNITN